MNLEGSSLGLILRYCPGILLKGVRNITKHISQDTRSPGRDLNLGLPEYEVGVLTTQPRRSVHGPKNIRSEIDTNQMEISTIRPLYVGKIGLHSISEVGPLWNGWTFHSLNLSNYLITNLIRNFNCFSIIRLELFLNVLSDTNGARMFRFKESRPASRKLRHMKRVGRSVVKIPDQIRTAIVLTKSAQSIL
jgi:hypothetical protein